MVACGLAAALAFLVVAARGEDGEADEAVARLARRRAAVARAGSSGRAAGQHGAVGGGLGRVGRGGDCARIVAWMVARMDDHGVVSTPGDAVAGRLERAVGTVAAVAGRVARAGLRGRCWRRRGWRRWSTPHGPGADVRCALRLVACRVACALLLRRARGRRARGGAARGRGPAARGRRGASRSRCRAARRVLWCWAPARAAGWGSSPSPTSAAIRSSCRASPSAATRTTCGPRRASGCASPRGRRRAPPSRRAPRRTSSCRGCPTGTRASARPSVTWW